MVRITKPIKGRKVARSQQQREALVTLYGKEKVEGTVTGIWEKTAIKKGPPGRM